MKRCGEGRIGFAGSHISNLLYSNARALSRYMQNNNTLAIIRQNPVKCEPTHTCCVNSNRANNLNADFLSFPCPSRASSSSSTYSFGIHFTMQWIERFAGHALPSIPSDINLIRQYRIRLFAYIIIIHLHSTPTPTYSSMHFEAATCAIH